MAQVIGWTLALAGAAAAAFFGYEVLAWALTRPGGPTSLDYVIFAGLMTLVGLIGGLPGLLVIAFVRRGRRKAAERKPGIEVKT